MFWTNSFSTFGGESHNGAVYSKRTSVELCKYYLVDVSQSYFIYDY